MDDDVIVNNFLEDVTETGGLSKNEVIKLLYNQDDSIALIAPEKFKSPIWERFRVVYYKGVKLNFVQCIGCSLVLVYKSRTGTASLLRHRCNRFPISVYDLKLAAAGQQFDLLNEMASSSHNGNIELKQEMLSDDETLEMPEISHQHDDQQFSNEQTNKGLMESFSLLEKTFMTGDDDLMLTREEVELAQRNSDPDLFFERPRNHRHSNTWDRFEIVYYRDIRQNFAKCLSCSSIVSYKKTTGTASLIRHKCKVLKTPAKAESLINLLTQTKTPPALTPAPVFDAPSSSSTTVSSSAPVKREPQPQQKPTRSENFSLLDIAARNLALSQIHWLSQSLVSTEVVSDSAYLAFLQNLVNFGADFGKQKVSNIINRNVITQQMIPKRCESVQTDLMNALKDTEFTISFRKWCNMRDEHYVTVFGYFFTTDFDYRTHILGTRRCDSDDNIMTVVRDISDNYKTIKDAKLKCVTELTESDIESFPCIVSQISKVITAGINANPDGRKLFKKLFIFSHEILGIPIKTTFDESTEDEKVKTLFEFYQHLKSTEDLEHDGITEKFMQLLGPLFAAIVSLTETSDDGARCVTANKVYLWFTKLLKLYSAKKVSDEIAATILKTIESIKLHEIYQVAVFLDPNFKNLKFLESSERTVLLDIVRKNLQQMMGDDDTSEPPEKKHKINQSKSHVNDTFLEFMDITMESVDDQVNSEIQCYMGHKLENPVDIVEFWRENDCFPYLKKLARNFLNLPSCTFHSNCCFLSAGNELYQKCQNLPADDIETLTFLHQNL